MKSTVLFLLGVWGALFLGCAGTRPEWQQSDRPIPYPVAVIVRDVSDGGRGGRWGRGGEDASRMKTVDSVLSSGLVAHGFKVVSRADIDPALVEMHLGQSGVTKDGAAKLGSILNARSLLIATVLADEVGRSNRRHDDGYVASAEVEARIICVESAEVLWIGRCPVSVRADSSNVSAVSESAARLAIVLPYRELPVDSSGQRYDPRKRSDPSGPNRFLEDILKDVNIRISSEDK